MGLDQGDDEYEPIRDHCGLAAAVNIPNAAALVRDMLWAQQHRGEKSAGIISFEGTRQFVGKRMGKVYEAFTTDRFFDYRFLGDLAIGHVRYATMGGADDEANIQPFYFSDSPFGQWAFAHNGQVNDAEFKAEMIGKGMSTQSNSDSEMLARFISQEGAKSRSLEEAIGQALRTIPAAYSCIVATPEQVIGFRDPHGVRPLHLGEYRGGFVLASETIAFNVEPGIEPVYDLGPGEVVVIERGKPEFRVVPAPEGAVEHFCSFECVYFQNPRSTFHRVFHEDFRYEAGKRIFEENKAFFSSLQGRDDVVVVPILDSGKQAAWGFKDASGIPYYEAFMRMHNVPKADGRSYTQSTQAGREDVARRKLHLRGEKVAGKSVITVDDSIVRSTTAQVYNKRLREAGAKEIINLVASPPVQDICSYGMNHQDRSMLIAHKHPDPEDIARIVGAERVVYLSLGGLQDLAKDVYGAPGMCMGCFGGKYLTKK